MARDALARLAVEVKEVLASLSGQKLTVHQLRTKMIAAAPQVRSEYKDRGRHSAGKGIVRARA
jgi:hypothetical protein